MSPDRFDDQFRNLFSLFFAQRVCLPSRFENRSRPSPTPDRFDQTQRARKPDETWGRWGRESETISELFALLMQSAQVDSLKMASEARYQKSLKTVGFK